MKDKVITVRVSQDTYEALKNTSKEQDLSVSWLVNNAIKAKYTQKLKPNVLANSTLLDRPLEDE